MVADSLIYHPTVTHYLKYTSTTAGRDKALRLVQYWSRFYAWYLYRTNNPKASIEPWEKTKKTLGVARKLLRLGKFVEHLKAAAVASDKKGMDPVLKYCAVGRQLGYAGYLGLDNSIILDTMGVRKMENKARISREANRCWLTGITLNLIAGTYTLYQLRLRASSLNKTEAEAAVDAKKLEKEWNATTLQLIQDACDWVNPATSLGILALDDGAIGLSGIVSSLLGIYGVWKKTA